MASVSMNKVGFECEFVTQPSKEFPQSECPVCLHILREPYQVTCCGKSFCKDCIKRVKGDRKPCPCCNEDDVHDFPNKGLQQPLYDFQVYCSNKDSGCEWKGELGQLDHHLNVSQTTPENELEGCQHSNINCTFCQNTFVRSELHYHKTELCDKRPFSCEHCNAFESIYEDVIHNHWPVCDLFPVKCPNECGAFPQRRHTKSHVEKDCPLTLVACDFNYIGCKVRLPRKNVPDHLREDQATHLSLLAISHKKQQHEIKELKERQQDLQGEISKLKLHEQDFQGEISKLKLHVGIVPVHFMIHGFSQYHFDIKQWISPHFYSHSNGYKLCLRMYYTEEGVSLKLPLKGLTHPYPNNDIVLNCYLLPGEYDNQLKWPFEGRVALQILPKQEDVHLQPFVKIIKLNAAVQRKQRTRETDGMVCGKTTMKVKDVQQYINNDCLKISII